MHKIGFWGQQMGASVNISALSEVFNTKKLVAEPPFLGGSGLTYAISLARWEADSRLSIGYN